MPAEPRVTTFAGLLTGVSQLYVVPVGTKLPFKPSTGDTLEKISLLHMVSTMSLICAVGLTVIVNVSEGPGQDSSPFVNVGVTVKVDTNKSVVVFIAVKLMSPVPDNPEPKSTVEDHE